MVRGRGGPNGLAESSSTTSRSDGYVWEMSAQDHVHYVPLRAMTPPGAHDLVAGTAGAWTATPPRCPVCG